MYPAVGGADEGVGRGPGGPPHSTKADLLADYEYVERIGQDRGTALFSFFGFRRGTVFRGQQIDAV